MQKYFLVSENSCERLSPSWEWHKVDKDNHFEVCRPDSKSHTCYKILLRHLQQYMFSPSDVSSLHVINVRDAIKILNSKALLWICSAWLYA